VVVILCLFGLGVAPASSVVQPARPVLVLSAMQKEEQPLLKMATGVQAGKIGSLSYYIGRINSVPVIIAKTGVGNVRAAQVATLLINHFHPRAVVFSGVAVSLQSSLKVDDVVVASEVFDIQSRPTDKFAAQRFQTTVPLNVKQYLPLARVGSIATDQHFHDVHTRVQDLLLQKRGVLALGMEDTGIAQASHFVHIPLTVIRAISDNVINGDVYTQPAAIKAARVAAKATARCLQHL